MSVDQRRWMLYVSERDGDTASVRVLERDYIMGTGDRIEVMPVAEHEEEMRWVLEQMQRDDPAVEEMKSAYGRLEAEHEALREAARALDEALSAALVAVQAFVAGDGPRGAALLPLLKLANDAADKRDVALSSGVLR